jgi:hypothetical protein
MVDEMYDVLRNRILTAKPTDIGLEPAPNEIWGVLTEMRLLKGVATLVALADGTVSLYFSDGRGFIGLGPHPGPRRVGQELIALAQSFVDAFSPTTHFPLPELGFMRFYLLSGACVLESEAREDDLGRGGHPLWPLFQKANELTAEIRAVQANPTAESDRSRRW